MTLADVDHIHFSGIKGVGMTALALYAQDMGYSISGSDIADEFVTQKILDDRNIPISIGLTAENLPDAAQALIYSAVHANNAQIERARKRNLPCVSYAQALGLMTGEKDLIATCGVGGKTTTAAMIATILNRARRHPSFVVGVGNIPNLGVPGRYDGNGQLCVVEADDYVAVPVIDPTPKFLYLKPDIIIATNIEHDHPDVYANLEETKRAFERLFAGLSSDGLLIANADSKNLQKVLSGMADKLKCAVVTYGYSPRADWKIREFRTMERKTSFTVEVDAIGMEMELSVPGKFNAANATAAMIAAREVGVSQRDAIASLKEFSGTERRFQRLGSRVGVEVWDDYAHHPSEIRATIEAARLWFPGKKLVIVFQPHTFSRTKALLTDFAKTLSLADSVIVTDIFGSEREREDPSISGNIVAQETRKHRADTRFLRLGDVLEYLKRSLGKDDVVMTLGAGDIYKIAELLVDTP